MFSVYLCTSFLIELFGLFICIFLSSLHSLDISPLSDTELVKLFSHSVGCHLALLAVSMFLNYIQTTGFLKTTGFQKRKIEQIDKTILDINNNLDKMYMDKLQGIILEEDYIRVSQKLIFDRTNLTKQKEDNYKKCNSTSNNKNKRKQRSLFLNIS